MACGGEGQVSDAKRSFADLGGGCFVLEHDDRHGECGVFQDDGRLYGRSAERGVGGSADRVFEEAGEFDVSLAELAGLYAGRRRADIRIRAERFEAVRDLLSFPRGIADPIDHEAFGAFDGELVVGGGFVGHHAGTWSHI